MSSLSKRIPMDIIAADRILCERSLAAFVKRAWRHIIPNKYIHNWHIDAVCEHLEAVADGDLNRLLVNVPPGTMKSTLVGVMLPAWLWGPKGRPDLKYIGAAHEQGLAVRDARLMRELITSTWYQLRWPVDLASDQNEKLYFENMSRGFRQATAVASMTGRRGDIITWDDPLSPEKAHSAKHRETAIRILRETLPTRMIDPQSSSIIVMMQRLHDKDPSGYILKNELGYEHLCLPMEYEPSRKCVTSIGFSDPRTKEGELLFPERFPAEVVERDKVSLGSYAVAGQYQQRPAPVGGGIIKAEWWRYYRVLPELEYRVVYADTAQKTGEDNDYSVFELWGKGTDGNAYLIDVYRKRLEAPQLLASASSFWQRHQTSRNGHLRVFKVEDKSSGTGLIQQFRQIKIPVEGIPRTKDKVVRLNDAAPLVEAGRVYLPESAPWLSDFTDEVELAPNGEFDDQVDPMCDAIMDMLVPTNDAPRMSSL